MKITESGIYYDMSSADYFADCCPTPSFTQSIAKIVIDRRARSSRMHQD